MGGGVAGGYGTTVDKTTDDLVAAASNVVERLEFRRKTNWKRTHLREVAGE